MVVGGRDDQGGDADRGEVVADVYPPGEFRVLDGAVGDFGGGVGDGFLQLLGRHGLDGLGAEGVSAK
ncbi:hypothetical protein ACFV1H_26095 [Streptomyces virginiae]|uniref:hypothetical protein n=1 Tax=Streptomyces virginiae TaxID=1961 RepID=UPI0036C74561